MGTLQRALRRHGILRTRHGMSPGRALAPRDPPITLLNHPTQLSSCSRPRTKKTRDRSDWRFFFFFFFFCPSPSIQKRIEGIHSTVTQRGGVRSNSVHSVWFFFFNVVFSISDKMMRVTRGGTPSWFMVRDDRLIYMAMCASGLSARVFL